jgi:hypothetical protein
LFGRKGKDAGGGNAQTEQNRETKVQFALREGARFCFLFAGSEEIWAGPAHRVGQRGLALGPQYLFGPDERFICIV